MWKVERTVVTTFTHLVDTEVEARCVAEFDTPTFVAFHGLYNERLMDYKFEKDGPDVVEEIE